MLAICHHQLSAISYQLSATSYQLPAICQSIVCRVEVAELIADCRPRVPHRACRPRELKRRIDATRCGDQRLIRHERIVRVAHSGELLVQRSVVSEGREGKPQVEVSRAVARAVSAA